MNFIVISVKIKSRPPYCDVSLFTSCYISDHEMAGQQLTETKKASLKDVEGRLQKQKMQMKTGKIENYAEQ